MISGREGPDQARVRPGSKSIILAILTPKWPIFGHFGGDGPSKFRSFFDQFGWNDLKFFGLFGQKWAFLGKGPKMVIFRLFDKSLVVSWQFWPAFRLLPAPKLGILPIFEGFAKMGLK